jgi:hypothetical protein
LPPPLSASLPSSPAATAGAGYIKEQQGLTSGRG